MEFTNKRNKLTNEQIEEIKKLYRPTPNSSNTPSETSYRALAEKFHVSIASIIYVVKGRRKPNLTPLERFMKFVDKSSEHAGCWMWTGERDVDGYGGFGLTRKEKRAHRASWILHRGDIPNGSFVLHKCDKPACVNPDHLFLGTHQDNIADKVAKGRNKRTLSILTEDQVREIRRSYVPRPFGRPKGLAQRSGGMVDSIKGLAKKYGVSPITIKKIIRKQTWKDVTDEREEAYAVGSGKG